MHARYVISLGVSILLAFAGAVVVAPPAAAAVPPDYQDPFEVSRPVDRPATPSCTVKLMEHDFAFSYGQPFVGTFAPPPGCGGGWSKVVLDWNASVRGRQYDRIAGVWVGGVEVLRTSTAEPSPQGIAWHVEKDVTAYAPVFRRPAPLVVDLGNLVNDV